jgi:hypothetical protein
MLQKQKNADAIPQTPENGSNFVDQSSPYTKIPESGRRVLYSPKIPRFPMFLFVLND